MKNVEKNLEKLSNRLKENNFEFNSDHLINYLLSIDNKKFEMTINAIIAFHSIDKLK